jgi:CheY-like chemotaxis protein
MQTKLNPMKILMADDDPDDRMLIKEALDENKLPHILHFVEDGKQLLDYLYNRGEFASKETFRPGLILLDLNMPRIDGREALKIIKGDPQLRRIPVVVLTTSRAEEDIYKTYDLGVNSFICKPVRFEELVEVTKEIGTYWFSTVALSKY